MRNLATKLATFSNLYAWMSLNYAVLTAALVGAGVLQYILPAEMRWLTSNETGTCIFISFFTAIVAVICREVSKNA